MLPVIRTCDILFKTTEHNWKLSQVGRSFFLKFKGDKMENHEPIQGFFRDDGTPINPELVPKPSLCILCRKDDSPSEEFLCLLTRADQEGSTEFVCDAFAPKNKKL